MQTALSTADIRYLIAWDDTLRPRDLAHLARVSHDWQDVAEAALWANLPDLTYLLKLMPRHLWSYAPKQRTWYSAEPRYLRLMRALIPSDWTPALRKSALIRRLTINCVYTLSVQEAIMACPPPAGFLCRMRSLELLDDCLMLDRVSLHFHFLPSIVPLEAITHLKLRPTSVGYKHMLPLVESCSNLHEVYFSDDSSPALGDGPRISYVDSLHAIGSRVSSLRLVIALLDRQPDADIPYLRHISQIPSLTSLCIGSAASKSSFRRPISYDVSAFSHLRTLRTVNCPALMAADIIRLAATRVEYIDFNVHGAVTAAEVDLLVRAVCERCSTSILHDLYIVPKDYTEDDPLQHLAPLAHFQNTRLRFMNSNYAVRDGSLRIMSIDPGPFRQYIWA